MLYFEVTIDNLKKMFIKVTHISIEEIVFYFLDILVFLL